MNDVDDGRGSDFLQVFDEGARVSAIGVGGVDALGREVVQLFVIRIHDYFFLVSVLERLRPEMRHKKMQMSQS